MRLLVAVLSAATVCAVRAQTQTFRGSRDVLTITASVRYANDGPLTDFQPAISSFSVPLAQVVAQATYSDYKCFQTSIRIK